MTRARRAARLAGYAFLIVAAALVAAHFAIVRAARLSPPAVSPVLGAVEVNGAVRRFGDSYVRARGALLEVGLRGDPTRIGYAHARLLHPEMVENEGILLGRFQEQVPSRLLRGILLDLAQLRYRNVDREMSPDRLREIAAGALGFDPDPYRDLFPTFQRFVYLNALYDMSLSFEHSPLIGCTTFTFGGASVAGGGGLLARAFDFEVDEIFDRKKAVFLVEETGRMPFASVAWPGLVGVVSGMNLAGVAVVVHGGRAGEPRASGEPVVHALRRVLGTAHDSEEAVKALAEHGPMVSHIVIVTDAAGRAASVERVPGHADTVRWLAPKAATTNHFEGPSSGDQKNLRVRDGTSTLPRRARADELLAALSHPATPADAVALLRDRRGPGGQALPLGDRRAIDALIATHGVIMDTATKTLWVSESPHLLGRFVAFDLPRLLGPDYDPERPDSLPALPADPLLDSPEYRAHHAAPPSAP